MLFRLDLLQNLSVVHGSTEVTTRRFFLRDLHAAKGSSICLSFEATRSWCQRRGGHSVLMQLENQGKLAVSLSEMIFFGSRACLLARTFSIHGEKAILHVIAHA